MSKVILKRGYIEPDEFVNICRWKTNRPQSRYSSEDNLKTIKTMSKDIIAFHLREEQDRTSKSIKLLKSLNGVQVPVASALLTVMFPKTYCVIDYRVRRAIYFLENSKNGILAFEQYSSFTGCLDITSKGPSVKDYVEYLQKISRESTRLKCTPRELEMALWEYDSQVGEKK
ncbi:MAG: hypothetical protein KA053_06615 [Lentimicrobiaceae bacterium]|nr:hypothetical protein [Lentimicrobiaceae bacterium]